METIGDILRNKRLEKGLTLEDVSNLVKIRKKYLEALESGNYNEIPGTVYAKSFLKIYADFLGLDRFYILKRYQSEIMPEQNIVIPPTYYMPINNQKSKRASRTKLFLYIIATIIGIVLIAIMMRFTSKGIIKSDSYVKLETIGLYWHLVDIIWIFLFPLFYLIT